MTVSAYTISHGGRQQGFYGSQYSYHHGGGKQSLQSVPCDVGQSERRNGCFYLSKLVSDGAHVQVRVSVQEIYAHSHDDDGNQRTGYLLRHLGRESDDDYAQDTHGSCYPVYGVQVVQINSPFADEISRQLPLYLQTQQVLDLRGEDGDSYTTGESYHYGVWDKLDDGTQSAYTQQNQEGTCQHGGNDESRQTQLRIIDYSVYNNYKGSCRSAYLHLASAQCTHYETAYDGSKDALRGRYARSYTEGYGQR